MAKKKLTGLEALVENVQTVVQAAQTAFLRLDQIQPDRQQPRHVLPNDLAAHYWQTLDPKAILDEWQALARDDASAAAAYTSLTELANSIAADGLINPITVLPAGDGAYRIRSGERRWWAHQLLHKQGRLPKGGQVGHIEVIIRRPEDTQSIVHQLAENLQREDLSAVEVAIGLAEMIALIEGIEVSAQGDTPLERLNALRTVAERPRLKEGTWDEVTRRLGKTRAHWAHYLALLRLPDESIQVAYEQRLTEGALRQAVFERDPEHQATLVQAAAEQKELKRKPVPAEERKHKPDKGAARIVAQKKFTNSLRSFGQALDALDEQGLTPRAVVKELAADKAQFSDLAHTAKRLLPVLQAIVSATEKPKTKAKAKPKTKASPRPRSKR